MKLEKLFFYLLLCCLISSCTSQRKAEKATGEVTGATLDSIIVYYLDELEMGTDMIKTTQEQYKVLDSLENRLVEQLQECLEDEELMAFNQELVVSEREWKRQQDSIKIANEDVTFEDGPESKEMFLTWQYTYLKELRIIELLELRDQNCG